MRGSPPLHLLLLAAAFVLVAIPLSRLTCARGDGHEQHAHHDHEHGHDHDHGHAHGEPVVVKGADEHPEEEHVHELKVLVRLLLAHKPKTVSLLAGEKELLKEIDWASAETPLVVEAELVIAHDGNELVLEAEWPEGTPLTAVTVELEPEGLEKRSETRWAEEGEVSDVLTFTW